MKHSNPKPYVKVNPGKGYKEVTVNGVNLKKTRKGTKILRSLAVGRFLKSGELVEVKTKPITEEVTNG